MSIETTPPDPPGHDGEIIAVNADRGKLASPSAAGTNRVTTYMVDEAQDVDVRVLFADVLEHRLLICAVTAVAIALGVLYLLSTTRLYQADALLQLQTDTGRSATLNDVVGLPSNAPPVEAEKQILESRYVLGRVVKRLQLDMVVEPDRMPLVGTVFARLHGTGPAPAQAPLGGLSRWLDLSRYAWGGEELVVDRLMVPDEFLGTKFSLETGLAGSYRFRDPRGRIDGLCQVAEPCYVLAGDSLITLSVSKLVARPGTRFNVRRLRPLEAIAALKEAVEIREQGDRSGVLGISLVSPSAILAQQTLNEILRLYVGHNTGMSSEEARATLSFLESQLPSVKSDLQTAERALSTYRSATNSVDLGQQFQDTLQRITRLEGELLSLRTRRMDRQSRITPSHPDWNLLDDDIAIIESELGLLKASTERTPRNEEELGSLARDVDVKNAVYTELLNKKLELQLLTAGAVGNARVIDMAAQPHSPVAPRPPLVLGISAAGGMLLGLVLAFVRTGARGAYRFDASRLERQIRLPVLAKVPHSSAQTKLMKRGRSRYGEPRLLAARDPEDLAVEGLRSLRTILHSGLAEHGRKVIAVTGPGHDVGKSFVSVNLGTLLASFGKRVAVVDCDLHTRQLNGYFSMSGERGLTDALSGRIDLDDAIFGTSIRNLSVVFAGSSRQSSRDLLAGDRFGTCLSELSDNFDYVIVDTPPVLESADAAIVSVNADATIIVVRAGAHSLSEVEQCVRSLEQSGANLCGLVYNGVRLND